MDGRVKKVISYLIVAAIFFGVGCIFGKYHFITNDVRNLNSAVEVKSKSGEKGIIPAGSELHFHSSAHRTTKYFVFIELSDSEVSTKVNKNKVSHSGGIQPLAGSNQNGL
tara:strand:+ start:2932 stop:3261 length:330 start_codon:yes stop_codon:yes gene_type:complete